MARPSSRPAAAMLAAMAVCLGTAAAQAPRTEPIDAQVAAALARIDEARIEATVRALVAFGTRHVASATDREDRGTGAARRFLQSELAAAAAASGGRLEVSRQEFDVHAQRLRRDLHLCNVVATLRGTTDPDRVYVVGGHYDSINGDHADAEGLAPGANDDATGTAVVVEACRALVSCELPATVLFVCYDGEEMGLLGSTEHAARLHDANVQVDGMITNDIVGGTLGMDGVRRDDDVRCFSYAARGNDSSGRNLARVLTYAARRHLGGFQVRLVLRGDRYGRGGDHRPFFQAGYPAVRLTEPRETYSRQHQNVTERSGRPYGDLPDFVDYSYVARVCKVNVAAILELASAPPAPASVRIRGARDRYDVEVEWPQVAGAESYELVWRATTAADWEHARLVVGGATRATLVDECIDDVVVGVRSVATSGARSRATTPPEPDAFDSRPRRGR